MTQSATTIRAMKNGLTRVMAKMPETDSTAVMAIVAYIFRTLGAMLIIDDRHATPCPTRNEKTAMAIP